MASTWTDDATDSIGADRTLAELVLDEPGRSGVFERLGFDYCCRGERTLREACSAKGLDLHTVAQLLAATTTPTSARDCDVDLRHMTTADLCDHIVLVHHDRLRSELPRLSETIAVVTRVHGAAESSLHDLARVFERLRAELEEHIVLEETLLFPACRTARRGAAPLDDVRLLDELGHDHTQTGEMLLALRDLAGGYRGEQALCGTHRAMLNGLRELELDVHRHIHEENNLLFPRVRALLGAEEGDPS